MHEVRRATTDDIPELIRLASQMFESMGVPTDGTEWRRAGDAVLRERLGGDRIAAFVVDDPGMPGRLAACGAAIVTQRLPGPHNPFGQFGYVQWMTTDPRHRRQGMARAVFAAITSWLDARGVTTIELHATPLGEPLYRSFGFEEPHNPQLRLRMGDADSGEAAGGGAESD